MLQFAVCDDSIIVHICVRTQVILLGFRAMKPAPKIAITRFGAGVHSFWKPEKDLPAGIVPLVIKSWKEAGVGGYFVV